MEEFKKKYPYADFSNFYVDTDDYGHIRVFTNVSDLGMVSVEGLLLLKDEYTKRLYINKPANHVESKPSWPNIWRLGGTVKDLQNMIKGGNYDDDWYYPKHQNLGFPINNFRVYVNDKDYFMSMLPPISASWSRGKTIDEKQNTYINEVAFDYKKESYFAMLCGAYISSYLCGISLMNVNYLDSPKVIESLIEKQNTGINQVGFGYKEEPYFAMIAGAYVCSYLSGISLMNLNYESNPKIVESLVRYHFYYQIRKFMKHPELLDKYSFTAVREHIPYRVKEVESEGTDRNGNEFFLDVKIEYSSNDYLSFISPKSNGLTKIGEELLQESIESFVYSILGSQARCRWSIIKGARGLQTQDIFRQIVNDTIVQNDINTSISNMRKAIADTNVTLNLAITPDVILMPSNLIILDKSMPGYNNFLTVANSRVSFGVNSKVNYMGVKKDPPKNVHQPDKPVEHLDDLDKVDKPKKPTDPASKAVVKSISDNHNTEILALLGVSSLSTFLVVKYML